MKTHVHETIAAGPPPPTSPTSEEGVHHATTIAGASPALVPAAATEASAATSLLMAEERIELSRMARTVNVALIDAAISTLEERGSRLGLVDPVVRVEEMKQVFYDWKEWEKEETKLKIDLQQLQDLALRAKAKLANESRMVLRRSKNVLSEGGGDAVLQAHVRAMQEASKKPPHRNARAKIEAASERVARAEVRASFSHKRDLADAAMVAAAKKRLSEVREKSGELTNGGAPAGAQAGMVPVAPRP